MRFGTTRFGVGHRLVGGFAAMWLAISLAFQSAVPVCPTHSVRQPASVSAQAQHGDHAPASASHDAHATPCECLTNCCVPTPGVSSRPVAIAAAAADIAEDAQPVGTLQSLVRREHATPFTTAPPNATA